MIADCAAGENLDLWYQFKSLVYLFNMLMSLVDLLARAAQRSSVIMMNEAHDGDRRCVRNRLTGLSSIPVLSRLGFRALAAEAFFPEYVLEANRTRRVPAIDSGYLAQPDFQLIVESALGLGWTLFSYESEEAFGTAQDVHSSNRRETAQAKALASAHHSMGPGARMFVWCGNSHNRKLVLGAWKPMGFQFRELTGIDPFSIDQTATVEFRDGSDSVTQILDVFKDEVEAMGGLGCLLRTDREDLPLDPGMDAYVLTDRHLLE